MRLFYKQKSNQLSELNLLKKQIKQKIFKQYVAKKLSLYNQTKKCSFFNILKVVIHQFVGNLIILTNITKFRNREKIKIGFILGGGIGDVIISILYLKKFCEKLDIKYDLHVFVGHGVENISHIINNQFPCKLLPISKYKKDKFDLLIKIDVQFPEILDFNAAAIKCSKFLTKYVTSVCEFCVRYSNLIPLEERFKQVNFALASKKDRISLMDINNILQLTKKDKLNPIIINNEKEILSKYGLTGRKFITLTRSINKNDKTSINDNTRVWPLTYYNKIIKEIKQTNPNIKIVQLGGKAADDNKMSDVDMNLSEKTTFQELLVLLKNAELHIDGECGMVHLRHFLSSKPSIVVFGPTNEQFLGYVENYNIRSSKCSCSYCEWLVGDWWQNYCLQTNSYVSPCMRDKRILSNAIEIIKKRLTNI